MKENRKLSIKRLLFLSLFMVYSIALAWFFSNYYFQSPIKTLEFQCFICKRYRVPVVEKHKEIKPKKVSNTPTDNNQATFGQMVYRAYKTVRFMESLNGKDVGLNKYCKSKGLINEVGYDPFNNFCFSNEAEQVATVINWFRNCLAGANINQCLGKYSGGSYYELN